MMLNVQELTARLSMMADPALQQYAAMHKDDPYVLALAVSEANRRRQVRTAQQGVAGMQPQPTVADQEVAQMNAPVMPEQVGIGALPAPALAGMPAGGIAGEEEQAAPMAGGGLVAFASGGDVERYQVGGMPPSVYERHRALYPRDKLLWGSGPTGYENMPLSDAAAKAASAVVSMFPTEEGERQKRARAAEEARMEALMKGYRPRPTMEPGEQEIAYEKANLAPTVTAAKAAQEELAAKTAAPGAPKPPAAPGAGAAPGARPATPAGGLSDLNALYNRILSGQTYTDPAAAQLKALETKEREAAEAEKADIQRDQAKFAEAFKGREARLAERGTEIGKQKDMNVGLALLNAGFAIMSTPGGLATAIGKGAQVGTQQFASGLDKIRSAQEKLDEARDRMEELKLNRDEMSAKEIRAANSKIRQVGIEAEKRGIDGLRQAAGVNRETAKTLFDKTVQAELTREEIAGRERAARISAGAPSAQMQMAVALGGGSSPEQLAEGLRKMNEAATGKTDLRTLYATYLSAAQKMPGTDVMSYAQFRAQFQIPVEPGNNPAAAPGTDRARPPGT